MVARSRPADGVAAVRPLLVRRRWDVSRLELACARVDVDFQIVDGFNIPVTPAPVKVPEFAAADF